MTPEEHNDLLERTRREILALAQRLMRTDFSGREAVVMATLGAAGHLAAIFGMQKEDAMHWLGVNFYVRSWLKKPDDCDLGSVVSKGPLP